MKRNMRNDMWAKRYTRKSVRENYNSDYKLEQYSDGLWFNPVHMTMRMMACDEGPKLPCGKDLLIKHSTLEYYFRKLYLEQIHFDDETYSISSVDQMIEVMAIAMVHVCDKQMWTNNYVSSVCMKNWYNGHKLIHLRHAQRLNEQAQLHVLAQRGGKATRVFIHMLHDVLRLNNIDSSFVNLQKDKHYEAQGWTDYFWSGFTWLKDKLANFGVGVVKSMAADQIKQGLATVFMEAYSKLQMVMSGIIDLYTKMIEPILTRIFATMKEVFPLIRDTLIVIALHAALFYSVKWLINKKDQQDIYVSCAEVLIKPYSRCELSKEDLIKISPHIVQHGGKLEFEAQSGGILSVFTGIAGLISSVMFGVFAPKYSSVFNSYIRSGDNIAKILEFVLKNFRDVVDSIYCSVNGKPYFEESKMIFEITQTFDEYSKMLVDFDTASVFVKHPTMVDKVIDFYKRIIKEDEIVRKCRTMTAMQNSRWNIMLTMVRHWYQSATTSKTCQKPRVVPLWLSMVGPPGIGKSTAINFIASAIYNKWSNYMHSQDETFIVRDYLASDRYERKVENEFWDAYKSQWMTTWDDLYQAKALETRALTSMELIYAINSVAYPLHMADIGQKDCTFFESKIVVTTSNVESFPIDTGINCIEALRRRCDFAVKVIVGDGVDFDQNFDATSMIESWHFRIFTGYGLNNTQAYSRDVTFDELVDLCFKKMVMRENQAKVMNTPPGAAFWEKRAVNCDLKPIAVHVPNVDNLAQDMSREGQPDQITKAQRARAAKRFLYEANKRSSTAENVKQEYQTYSEVVKGDFKAQMMDEKDWESSVWVENEAPEYTPILQPDEDVYPLRKFKHKPVDVEVPKTNEFSRHFFSPEEVKACITPIAVLQPRPRGIWDWMKRPRYVEDPAVLTLINFQQKYPNNVHYQELKDVFDAFDFEEKYDQYLTIQDNPGILGHFSDLSTFEDYIDIEYIDDSDFFIEYPWLLAEVNIREVTTKQTLQLSCRTLAYRCLVGMRVLNGGIDYSTASCVFTQAELNAFYECYFNAYQEEWDGISEIDFEEYAVSLDFASMAELINRGIREKHVSFRMIKSAGQSRYRQWKLGALISACTIVGTMAIGLVVWRSFARSVTSYAAQSYDKSHASKQKLLKRRARYGTSKPTPFLGKKQNRVPKPKTGKHNQRGGGKRQDVVGHWFRGEEDYIPQGDEESDSSSDEEIPEFEGQLGSPAINQLANKIVCNCEEVEIEYADGAKRKLVIFFTNGTVCFTVKHMMSFRAPPVNITIAGEKGSGGSYTFGPNQYKMYMFPDRDLIRIIFDKNCRSRSTLIDHLHPFADGEVISHPYRLEYDIDSSGDELRSCKGGTRALATTKKIATRTSEGVVTMNEKSYVVFDSENFKGDCGWPYIDGSLQETKRIFGIHVGGMGDRSLVVPIFPEDITVGIEPHEDNFIAQMSMGDPWFDNIEMTPQDGYFNVVPSYGGCRFLYSQKKKPYMPFRTKIVASPIQKGIIDDNGKHFKCPYAITRRPAALSGDGATTPLIKAMNKYTTVVTPKINQRLMSILEDDRTWAGCFPQTVVNLPRRPLTMDEAVLGVPAYGIKPMDLKTSPGYPFTAMGLKTCDLIKVKRWTGKTCKILDEIPSNLTGRITVEYDPRFLKAYNEEMAYYQRGEIPPHYVNDTLKDELRSLDRVADMNTRLFNVGSKVTLIIIKMIEGHLYADLERFREESDIAIGMNVHSYEWEQLHNSMLKFAGSRTAEGIVEEDLVNWDRCMSMTISTIAAKQTTKNLGYTPTDLQKFIIMASWRACMMSIHNSPFGFFIVNKEGSTGDYRTSRKNSMHNSVMHRACFSYLAPEELMWQFDFYIKALFYGDDVLASVKTYVRAWYNMVSIHDFLEEHFGFKTTFGVKKGEVDREFTTLEECSFLKRKFHLREENGMTYIFPILDRDSVETMPLWIENQKNDHETVEILYQTCQSAMMEWFYYGEAEYNTNYKILKDRMDVLGKNNKVKPEMQRFYVKEFWPRMDDWAVGYKDQ